jgi:AcrR family transcriptional regulator
MMKRPSSTHRRAAILKAAEEVFFKQGYAATSIDAIIARVGGSKRSIYNEFGNKAGLFSALVSESAEEALSPFTDEEINGQDLKEILLEFGRRLLLMYMSPKLIGVYRTIVTDGSRFPKLAQTFYEQGPGRAVTRLTMVLEEARTKGEIDIDDCKISANHFIGMLRGNLHLQVILNLRKPPCQEESENIIQSAVNVLLDGIHKKF